MSGPYVPIDCEFHDVLEAIATRRTRVPIVFRRDDDPVTLHARIVDIVVRDGAEYLVLDSGESIRLDRLIAVDGIELPRSVD